MLFSVFISSHQGGHAPYSFQALNSFFLIWRYTVIVQNRLPRRGLWPVGQGGLLSGFRATLWRGDMFTRARSAIVNISVVPIKSTQKMPSLAAQQLHNTSTTVSGKKPSTLDH
jgi:hypothetical protein